MTVATKPVTVRGMPEETLEYLKPYAARAGHIDGDASVLRYAATELERRLREEADKNGNSQPA